MDHCLIFIGQSDYILMAQWKVNSTNFAPLKCKSMPIFNKKYEPSRKVSSTYIYKTGKLACLTVYIGTNFRERAFSILTNNFFGDRRAHEQI